MQEEGGKAGPGLRKVCGVMATYICIESFSGWVIQEEETITIAGTRPHHLHLLQRPRALTSTFPVPVPCSSSSSSLFLPSHLLGRQPCRCNPTHPIPYSDSALSIRSRRQKSLSHKGGSYIAVYRSGMAASKQSSIQRVSKKAQ